MAAVAVVDILGQSDINAYLSTIVSTLNSVVTNIQQTNADLAQLYAQLTHIYDRLEHVKVDSYVNVRVVDEAGLLPVPCTEATGLLVTAYAANPEHVVLVNVQNPDLPVTISGTVDVNVTNTELPITITGPVDANITNDMVNVSNHLFDIATELWKPAPGFAPEKVGFAQNEDFVSFNNWTDANPALALYTVPVGYGASVPVAGTIHPYAYLDNASYVTTPYTTATKNVTNYALPT